MNHPGASYLLAIAAFASIGLTAGFDSPASDAAEEPRRITLDQESRTSSPRASEAPRDLSALDRESTRGGGNPAVTAEADRAFVRAAAQLGQEEIEAARDAMQRARRGDLRSAAKSMLDEHSEITGRLQTLAARKGWSWPTAPPASTAVSRPPDEDFDTGYLGSRRSAYGRAIELYRRHAASGGDPDLVAFSAETLPTLEQHLKTVDSLRTPGGQAP